jgi:hypothetical protein
MICCWLELLARHLLFFSPLANKTREGQAANRRIDFVILPRFDRVVKDIKKELVE